MIRRQFIKSTLVAGTTAGLGVLARGRRPE